MIWRGERCARQGDPYSNELFTTYVQLRRRVSAMLYVAEYRWLPATCEENDGGSSCKLSETPSKS